MRLFCKPVANDFMHSMQLFAMDVCKSALLLASACMSEQGAKRALEHNLLHDAALAWWVGHNIDGSPSSSNLILLEA